MTNLNPFISIIDYRGREIKNKVTKFKYKFSEKGDDVCEFTIETDDPMLPDEPHFQEGKQLTIQWGYKGGNKISKARRVYILDTEANYAEEGLSMRMVCHEKFVLAKMDKPANKNIEQLKDSTPILFSAPVMNMVNLELEANNEILKSLLAANNINLNSGANLGGYPIVSYYNGNQSSFRALKTYLDKLKGGPYVIDSRDDGVIIRTRDFKQPSKLTFQYRIGTHTVLKFRPETKNRSKKASSGQSEVVAWDKKNKSAVSQVSTEGDRGQTKLAGTPSLKPYENAARVENGKVTGFWVAPLGSPGAKDKYKQLYVRNPKKAYAIPTGNAGPSTKPVYDVSKKFEGTGLYEPPSLVNHFGFKTNKGRTIRSDQSVTIAPGSDVNEVVKNQKDILAANANMVGTSKPGSKLDKIKRDYGKTTTKKKNESLKETTDKAKAIIEQTHGGPGVRKIYVSYDYGTRDKQYNKIAVDNTAVAKPIHLLVSDDDKPGVSSVSPKEPKTARNQADNERKENELNANPATATIEGEPELESGMIVTFEGVAKRHAGNYYISECEHTWEESSGYLTEISKMSRQGINKANPTIKTKEDILPIDKYFYNSDKPKNFRWEDGSVINESLGPISKNREQRIKINTTTPDKV